MSETNPVEEPAAPSGPALRGDLTQGPILRSLLMFSIPTLIANMVQTFGQTANTIWVGRLIGEGALAATVNANMVVFLGFAAVFGFSMATTVKVGQNFGARELDAARRTFGTGTGFCTGVAIVGAALGWIFVDPLLSLLATPDSIHAMARDYLQISMIGIPLGTVQLMVSMSLRGAGDAKTPLLSVIMTLICVVALNPLLILGIGPFPALGIAGSALSVVIGNIAGLALMVGWIYLRDLPLRLRGSEIAYLVPQRNELGFVVGKGLPMGAQMFITSSSAVIMVGLVNREGMLTTAAYGAVMQIWNYIQMPSFAISTAVSAMVAQNIGAVQHGRVARITNAGLLTNTAVTLLLALTLVALDKPLIALFLGGDSAAIPVAEHIILIATWSWILSGMMMIMSGTMRSYGVVIVPLIIMAISLYPARLGFYFLFFPQMGADALWWSYPFGSAVALALTWWAYERGRWRRDLGVDAALAAGN